MKVVSILALLLFAQISYAKEYQLGVILGAPTGISGKIELQKNRAVDGVIAYSFAHDFGLEIHSDYLVENIYTINVNAQAPLGVYTGIGGRFGFINKGKHDGDVALGPRVPVGVNYKIVNPNIEFFGEVALILDLVPESSLDLEGGVGLRYRF